MNLLFKLAFKNLLAAGLRTWLNVIVLSFSYVVIIFYNGLLDGWNQQARTDSIEWQFGQGQLWHADYDPYDPFSLTSSYDKVPPKVEGNVPIFIQQASIYPEGRMQTIAVKGIPSNQQLLKLPTQHLQKKDGPIPVIIGKRMAKTTKMKKGDVVTLRFRDKNGTFDVRDIQIASIFETNVPAIDNQQVWMSIEQLYAITGHDNQATLIVLNSKNNPITSAQWKHKDLDFLLADIDAIIASKKGSSVIIYLFLLTLALLAIFDTQVLSIFRRQKEIGTYIALGMTRRQVVGLFTIEGGANSILGALMGAVYGIPLFIYLGKNGIKFPETQASEGITMADTMYPVFGLTLVLSTLVLIVIASLIVSYMPARKIAKMDPTLALKGKIQ